MKTSSEEHQQFPMTFVISMVAGDCSGSIYEFVSKAGANIWSATNGVQSATNFT
ncbi:MAG: hypothetical protein ACYDER_12670 [Ktedonobacteraceae bacterium]